jgi:serine phosphatase RsbU (regulator of sigma subunit)
VVAEQSKAFVDQLVPQPTHLRRFDTTIHYEPGVAGLQVGGDFIDVVELPDGAAAFVVGDVCGHGLGPAALGVALRTTWRSLVRLMPSDPAGWLQELQDAFSDELEHGFATVATGIVAADGRRAEVSSAGHPYPILLGPNPTLQQLRNDPPLGLGAPGRARTNHALAVDGRPLLLFTDGLWESQRISPDGTRAPIEAVSAAVRSVDWLDGRAGVESLVASFRPPDGSFDDDVAILLIDPRSRTA